MTSLPVLRYDADRATAGLAEATGIYVRAQRPDGTWDDADIAELDADSLLTWLRSRGGSNPWAEQVVLILLGHPRLAELRDPPPDNAEPEDEREDEREDKGA